VSEGLVSHTWGVQQVRNATLLSLMRCHYTLNSQVY
jgi:hypothetical protein